MKTYYEEPALTVHEFSIEDILTTSSGGSDASDSYGNGLDLPGVGWGS